MHGLPVRHKNSCKAIWSAKANPKLFYQFVTQNDSIL